MPDPKTALRVYNETIKSLDYLCKLGDHSDGERLKIYSIMAPNCLPPYYENWRAFYDKAIQENFVNNPRDCWTLIRISKHGTIEFRMLGSTQDFGEIIHWARFCHKICQ
jgi:gamma-glutamyl:cysteine ligase YbdK (ATP-grasp superfamily)